MSMKTVPVEPNELTTPTTNYTAVENLENGFSKGYVMSWKNIQYTVDRKSFTGKSIETKKILKGITGRTEPGQVTAIMGPSGSGKTTLLDILADRVSSGTIEGIVSINGEERDVRYYRRIASYVAQEDSLLGSFTVVETLRYAADLALPSSISKKEKESRVQSVIDEMGLRVCENILVGDLFRKGISGGQKRRLSIGIELLSNPSILLLDEPTSGLDSSSTYNVMKHIVHLAQQGKTILCTIHQPSADVYNMFNHVMFLVAGETAYYGTPSGALDHFKKIGHECPQYTNPADYYMGLINLDFEGHADVPSIVSNYNSSTIFSNLNSSIQSDAKYGGIDKEATEHLLPSAMNQFFVLMKRNTMNNIRNPGIYWVRLVMYIMLCIMVGTMYIRTNDDIIEDDYIPLLFYVQAFLVFMSVAVLPFFIEQRPVLARERANSSLNVFSYVVANFLAAIPGIFLIALVSSILVIYLADMNQFGWFLLNLFLSLVVAESLMHVIGAAVPHYIIGIALGAGIFGMFMLCEGFMVPRDAMPDYWLWGYYMAFHTYSFETFMYNQFNFMESARATEILNRYDMLDVEVERNMIILAVYAIILECIFGFIVYKYHTGRR